MKTIYTENHRFHAPAIEVTGGKQHPCFEKPERAFFVLEAVRDRKLGSVLPPDSMLEDRFSALHEPAYISFLKTAHAEWRKAGYEGDAFAYAYNVQHPGFTPPVHIDGKMGYYTGDGTVPLTETSWRAIADSARVALTAQKIVAAGEKSAFALCRPPGHHATRAAASGYCFINNAALAAQGFLDDGAGRVAVLDVDYHHGNGTQDIFYDRDDVLFVSLHADPSMEYPYFAGYANETGRGKGEGYNLNYPLPFGTDYPAYAGVLAQALAAVRNYGPDALVVSLGVDTYEKDPISKFRLASPDYLKMGKAVAGLKLPTLFVMEGGYAIADVGVNVANVLQGFLDS
jgi:acetoin utilization deacetylase AcuC-like enzyme